MNSMVGGVILSLLAGVLNGSFAAPTKYARKWQWENIWSVWAITGMFVFPWLLVLATVPHAGTLYSSVSAREIFLLTLLGAGFGLAQIFFGLGIAAVGIALNFAIAVGISTALGSFVPLVFQHSDRIFTPQGEFILLGVVLTLAGIVFSAVAGREKEKSLRSSAPVGGDTSKKTMSFAAGLTLCVLAGLGSPLTNFGIAFCTSTVQRAVELGTSVTNKYNVIWAPLYTASLVPYLIYCIYLWRKNRSFRLFGEHGTGVNWFYGIVMAALWMGSSAIYGVAAARIGDMGPVLGWPLFMSVIIITSSIWGVLTGEWKGAGRKSANSMIIAIVFLVLGFATLAYSGSLG
ncbi:MAG TPA: L-rhamnose/proton symporter RhaT [Candidatus Acidoferrales bacterium]|nr:L-rhamnose/proton symporter RhaT [Candidatus Acidoferrales bacterium]